MSHDNNVLSITCLIWSTVVEAWLSIGAIDLQEPLALNKRVWILHKKRDGCVVVLEKNGMHYWISSSVNKNSKLQGVCEYPQQLVEVLQLVLHSEETIYPKVDGRMWIIDEALYTEFKEDEKLKWNTNFLLYASDNDGW